MSATGFKVSKTLIVLFILLLPVLLALLLVASPIILLFYCASRYYDFREHTTNVREKAKLKRYELDVKKNHEIEKMKLKIEHYKNNKTF